MKNEVESIANKFKVLGFTEYEAKILSALMIIGPATAKEISELSDVPRPKTYETLKNLANKGLIEIQYGKPMIFVPLSRDILIEKLKRSYTDVIDSLTQDLRQATLQKKSKPIYALTIIGENSVIYKLREIISKAKKEIKLVVVNPKLVFSAKNILKAVRERGVKIDCFMPIYDKTTIRELKNIIRIQVIEIQNMPEVFKGMFYRIRQHENFMMVANIDREEVYFIFRNKETIGVWIKMRAVAEIQALIIDSIIGK